MNSEPGRRGKWDSARGWALRLLAAAFTAIVALIALVYFSQHAMLYHPRAYNTRYANFLPPDGVEFQDCYPRREIAEIDGVEVDIISLADLRTNKKASGRYQDLSDLEKLG